MVKAPVLVASLKNRVVVEAHPGLEKVARSLICLQTQTITASYKPKDPMDPMDYLNESSTGLSLTELEAFKDLVPWIKAQRQKAGGPGGPAEEGVHETIMSTILAVRPSDFINDASCMTRPIRDILVRANYFGRLFSNSKAICTAEAINEASDGAIEGSIDIFTSEAPESGSFCAETPDGLLTNYFGSDDSWAYHFIINGPLHPATRQYISALAYIGQKKATTFPHVFLNKASQDILQEKLMGPVNEVLEVPTAITSALFEVYHKVPEDRSYVVNMLGMPPEVYKTLFENNLTNVTMRILLLWELSIEYDMHF